MLELWRLIVATVSSLAIVLMPTARAMLALVGLVRPTVKLSVLFCSKYAGPNAALHRDD